MVNQSAETGISAPAPWLSNVLLSLEIILYFLFNAAFEVFCIWSLATGTQHALRWCGRELANHHLPISHTRQEWESICSFIIGIFFAPLVLRWTAGKSIRSDIYYVLTLPSKMLSRNGIRNIGPAARVPTNLGTKSQPPAKRSASPVGVSRVRKR
jgi:hypothetical protein